MDDAILDGDAVKLAAEVILTDVELEEAKRLSESEEKSLKQILLENNFISVEVLKSAVRLQRLILRDQLPKDFAEEALLYAHCTGQDIDEALSYIGWKKKPDIDLTSRLGQIFVDAGVISENALTEQLSLSMQNGDSFCSCLAQSCGLSYSVINASLQSLSLMMHEKINAEQASAVVRLVAEEELVLWNAMARIGLDKELVSRCEISLGELLTSSGIVSETDRAILVELALNEHKRLGELILDQNLTSSRVLEAALGLQQLAVNGSIDKDEACQILRTINLDGSGVLAEIYAPFAIE